MLRYADYIDSASNLYEVPRPPRRGSHRPEAPAWATKHWTNVSPPPGLNGDRLSLSPPPPSLREALVTPLPSDFSLLGKRPAMTMAQETARLVNKNRSSALTRGSFVSRSDWKRNQTSRELAFPQLSRSARGRSTDILPGNGYDDRYLSQKTSGSTATNKIKQEFLPLRRSFDACESTRRAACTSVAPSATLAELVDQLNTRKGGRFSPSILESYAKTIPLSASCQTVQKRCMYPDCTKISVSRGLCRGHGGGRRCHFLGCAKSAQSRSNFCWAHGGGQRCDVPNCMRSRKTKRFCVAHIQFESLVAVGQSTQDPTNDNNSGTSSIPKIFYEYNGEGEGRKSRHTQPQGVPPQSSCKQQAPVATQRRYLPSLGQALSSASRSPPNLPGNFGRHDGVCARAD